MENKLVKCGKLNISNKNPFTLIAGPCQLENEKHALDIAHELKKITENLGIGLIYKTSFDKANRTSLKGKRGAGLDASLPNDIEVTKKHVNRVPKDYIRKQSLVNTERYISPKLKEYEEEITQAEQKIIELEKKTI